MFLAIAFVIGCHNFGFTLLFANDQVLEIQTSNSKLLSKKLLDISPTVAEADKIVFEENWMEGNSNVVYFYLISHKYQG